MMVVEEDVAQAVLWPRVELEAGATSKAHRDHESPRCPIWAPTAEHCLDIDIHTEWLLAIYTCIFLLNYDTSRRQLVRKRERDLRELE